MNELVKHVKGVVEKMTKYYIYKVHYTDNHDQFNEVEVFRTIDGQKFSIKTTTKIKRDVMIEKMMAGVIFETIHQKFGSTKWYRGKEIIIDDDSYIKTESSVKKSDNLGRLPEY